MHERMARDLIDAGLDALNPLEVKAGMDPVHIKQTYGDRLVLGHQQTGVDARRHPAEAKARMGVQLQTSSFQPELSIEQIAALYGGLYGLRLPRDRIRDGLAEIGLSEEATKRFTQLSGGHLAGERFPVIDQQHRHAVAVLFAEALVTVDIDCDELKGKVLLHLSDHPCDHSTKMALVAGHDGDA